MDNQGDHWLCVYISDRFLLNHDINALVDVFVDVFKDDYVEHHVLDLDNVVENEGFYTFVRCRNYVDHLHDAYTNRHIRNILNSMTDVVTVPPEEVLSVKKNTPTVCCDDNYRVNRSGFFLPGDIIQVTKGHLSQLQGVVLKKHRQRSHDYVVYFRLFVRSFTELINAEEMEFASSVFKHSKFPPKKKELGHRKLKQEIKSYAGMIEAACERKLIETPIRLPEIMRLPIVDAAMVLQSSVDAAQVLA